MELLKNKIRTHGRALNGHILKVDSFLNHQIDATLMAEIGKEFYRLFKDCGVTKIVTVESSGIAPAIFAAKEFNVDLVFARKKKSLTLKDGLLTAEVYSYTKQETSTITISKNYITKNDVILIIDDFLANGEVVKGLSSLIEQTGATVCGVGIVIEKSFQKGRAEIDKTGLRVESLARIASLENDVVTFLE